MLLAVPTVNAIQRTTSILTAVTAIVLFVFVSATTAVSSVIGAAVMIVNFYLLALAGKFLLATARDHGGPSAAGVLLPPLKLFFIIAVVYMIAASGRVSIPGFLAGVLTQFAAIFIESWRASARPVPGISGARGV